ncbi:MAG: hypothetical protein KDI56_14980, partial [Xanthomonadales bacterium]|nr:hypothetical protein [Xanthomonadales bacterium]
MIVRWLIASVVARSNPLSPQALADAAAISFQRDPECRRPAPGLPSPGSYCTTLAGLLLLLSSALPAAPARPDAASVSQISPTAQAQILALVEEKRARSPAQRKLDSTLWYALKRHRGDPLMAELPELGTGLPRAPDGRLLLDMKAHMDAALLDAIGALGGQVDRMDEQARQIQLRLPIAQLEALAEHPQVRALRPALPPSFRAWHTSPTTSDATTASARLGSVVSQGDAGHRVDVARSQYAVDGTGVTACAISDSVDELAQLQATGELPGDVFVLPGQAGVGTSEGTALLEIIHDLAPGASLGFARAGPNAAVMAANIRALRLAGCDVIIDDAYFLTEPVFQPGVIGQAIDDV